MDALSLGEGEALCYCVPADLGFDNRKMQAREAYGGQTWLAVTDRRFVVLKEEGAVASFFLEDCEKIKCEHQVHSGIVTVTKKDGQMICAARFSMRHIVRVAYAVRGAQALNMRNIVRNVAGRCQVPVNALTARARWIC